MKIAIIGYGWVGKAMHSIFPSALIFDPALGFTDDTNTADVAFICVPTPLVYNPVEKDGHLVTPSTPAGGGYLDTSIVEEAVKNCQCPLIVIRSTVMPGTCRRLSEKYQKNIVFQPEYLGETTNHPMTDQKARPFLILGGSIENRRKLIEVYQTVYNANITIRQTTLEEAEVIKLSENRAIAFKVAQCQELYDACQLAGVDYFTVRDAVYSDDPRFNLWWTFVFPDKRGFSSKCIPKDVYGWAAWAESVGYDPVITKAMLERNEIWLAA